LEKNPANGGIPANDNITNDNVIANNGCHLDNPANSVINIVEFLNKDNKIVKIFILIIIYTIVYIILVCILNIVPGNIPNNIIPT
jgi:hypothetical protein